MYIYIKIKLIEIDKKTGNIVNSTFFEYFSLTSIVLLSSITRIERDAFYYCKSLTIYCEAESEPSGWDADWNPSNCSVVWGYKKNN